MQLQKKPASPVGEFIGGCVDYFRHPEMKTPWGGPFNGQEFRKKMFFDLLANLSLETIVETGTYRGTTTDLFLSTALPVYSTESQLRYYAYSLTRFLSRLNRLHLYRKDSRDFLRSLAADSSFPKQNVFFYLDAHWEEDLPLFEELEIIISNWKASAIMIDDFCVPDTDYGYDDYGEGKALNVDYLRPLITEKNIPLFFPAAGTDKETGVKRGSVVLGTDSAAHNKLDRISSLKRFYLDR